MQILRRNKAGQGTMGLDIDGAYLAAAQVSGDRIQNAVSVPLEPGVVIEGEVANADALVESLREFVREHGLPRNVRLGVGNQQIAVRHLDLPKIADREQRETAVRFQASEAMPMPLDDAVVDYGVVSEHMTEDGAPRERVVVVAARRPMISTYLEPVRRAGLKPVGLDLDAFALVRVLGAYTNGDDPLIDSDAPARVLCHLGGLANLAVAKGNVCLFTRPLSTPWQGEGVSDALAEEMRISIDYYGSQPDSQPVGEILLSGDGAEDAELVSRLDELLAIPVSAPPPLGRMSLDGLAPGESPYRHTVSVGLAMGAS
jgi:type IV pilus assembly protein PilM